MNEKNDIGAHRPGATFNSRERNRDHSNLDRILSFVGLHKATHVAVKKEPRSLASKCKNIVTGTTLTLALFLFGFGLKFCIHTAPSSSESSNDHLHHGFFIVFSGSAIKTAEVALPLVLEKFADTFGRRSLIVPCILLHIIGFFIQSQSYGTLMFVMGKLFSTLGFYGISFINALICFDLSASNKICRYLFILTWNSNLDSLSHIVRNSAQEKENMWINIGTSTIMMILSVLPLVTVSKNSSQTVKHSTGWTDSKNRKFFPPATRSLHALVDFLKKFDFVGTFLLFSFFCMLPLIESKSSEIKALKSSHFVVPYVCALIIISATVWWEMKWARDPVVPFCRCKNKDSWLLMIMFVFCGISLFSLIPHFTSNSILLGGLSDVSANGMHSTFGVVFISVCAFVVLLTISESKMFKRWIIIGCSLAIFGITIKLFSSDYSMSNWRSILLIDSIFIGTLICYLTLSTLLLFSCVSGNLATKIAIKYFLQNIGRYLGFAISEAIRDVVFCNVLRKEVVKRLFEQYALTENLTDRISKFEKLPAKEVCALFYTIEKKHPQLSAASAIAYTQWDITDLLVSLIPFALIVFLTPFLQKVDLLERNVRADPATSYKNAEE